jgi:hypothetical protein
LLFEVRFAEICLSNCVCLLFGVRLISIPSCCRFLSLAWSLFALVKRDIHSWTSFSWHVGSRGPKPIEIAALKVNATQWFYLLVGLRDGHPDLLQKHVWGPWTGDTGMQICAGRAERIPLVRIIPDGKGSETALVLFQRLTTFANKTAVDEQGQFEHPLYQTIEQDTVLSQKWLFGLRPSQHPSLFFPALSPQPHLWRKLKNPRSIKEVHQIGNAIYEWIVAAVPGVSTMREFRSAVCDHAAELFRARKLWNYPRTDRPTSDDKRLEFFAETLAGLMLGVAPATATKKLSHWSPPRLWLIKFDADQLLK